MSHLEEWKEEIESERKLGKITDEEASERLERVNTPRGGR